MTKGYLCVKCGSQIVGHSKVDCDSGEATMLFEIWWNSTGRYIDPDTDDVSWYDKRKELAGYAYLAGREEVKKVIVIDCRCDCVNCVTQNHDDCYYEPKCPLFKEKSVKKSARELMDDMTKSVEETRLYDAWRNRIEKCGISAVQPVDCIVLNGVPHAGVVTHVCAVTKKHDGICQCQCGYEWKGK